MSASAIANQIQYQDAFANKKQQPHKQHEGGLSSHPAEPKSELNVNKVRLEDPFKLDDSKYLSNATYQSSSSSKPVDRDAVDDESIYSTPVGKSQAAAAPAAVDTPLPASTTKKDADTSSKDTDDYDKVVKVINDHIAKELPAVPQWKPESEPVEGQKQHSCCCGHKALEESAAAEEAKGAAVEESAEKKTDASESEEKSKGEEEKDEGDDTVIVTLKAAEPADETAQVEDKAEHVEKADASVDEKPEEKKTEAAAVADAVKAEK